MAGTEPLTAKAGPMGCLRRFDCNGRNCAIKPRVAVSQSVFDKRVRLPMVLDTMHLRLNRNDQVIHMRVRSLRPEDEREKRTEKRCAQECEWMMPATHTLENAVLCLEFAHIARDHFHISIRKSLYRGHIPEIPVM